MLADERVRDFFANLLPLLFIGFIFAVLIALIILTKEAFKGQDPKGKTALKTTGVALLCIAVAAASWIFNIGWLRVIATIIGLPVVHAAIFFFSCLANGRYIGQSGKLKKINCGFIITYLLCYLALPDGGDYGDMYFFFGLIQDSQLADIAFSVTELSFVAHTIFFILSIIERIKLKKRLKTAETSGDYFEQE